MTDLTTVAFRGGDILVTADQQIAIKPVCDAMGLDYSGQLQRLKRQPWATVGVTPTVAEDGKTREMATVDRRTFTMSVELATKVGLAGEKGGELSPALGGEVLA